MPLSPLPTRSPPFSHVGRRTSAATSFTTRLAAHVGRRTSVATSFTTRLAAHVGRRTSVATSFTTRLAAPRHSLNSSCAARGAKTGC